jgi:putative heme-binding domain-containing protein
VPRLSRAQDEEGVAKVIRQGVEGTEMPEARRTREEVARLAAWVRKLSERPPEKTPGDPARGQQLYLGKGGCAVCHAIRGRGGAVGTDLTDIGLRRGAAYLKTAILQPEASVPRAFSSYRSDISLAQNFLLVRAVTRAGVEVSGVRVNEDTFSIQIRDATNRVRSFWKSELRQLRKEWGRSPMPSYAGVFSPEELDDLVAFLAEQRER